MVGVYGGLGKCASRVRQCQRPGSGANAHMQVVACDHTYAYRVNNQDPAMRMPHATPSIAHGCTCLGNHAMLRLLRKSLEYITCSGSGSPRPYILWRHGSFSAVS